MDPVHIAEEYSNEHPEDRMFAAQLQFVKMWGKMINGSSRQDVISTLNHTVCEVEIDGKKTFVTSSMDFIDLYRLSVTQLKSLKIKTVSGGRYMNPDVMKNVSKNGRNKTVSNHLIWTYDVINDRKVILDLLKTRPRDGKPRSTRGVTLISDVIGVTDIVPTVMILRGVTRKTKEQKNRKTV